MNGIRVQGDSTLIKPEFTSNLNQTITTNINLHSLVKTACELQRKYISAGYTNVTVALGHDPFTNHVAVMTVFRGLVPQIVIDGRRLPQEDWEAVLTAAAGAAAASNAGKTNTPPGFTVRAYEIMGDTLLSMETLTNILVKYTGTNITVPDILKGASELQMEYRNRGYVTVKVTIPPQKLDTNAMVKIRVFQGRLSEINVLNNRYFSSNNVMRALPNMQTNMILVDAIFQAELDRANANPDRQIYPEVAPGPTEGTTLLDLNVKDRLPLHAKIEFNNQNSPGTPDLRLNTSLVYNNLWQYEHSMGLQYSFSPTDYKTGDQWAPYDLPLVANYGGFYRIPLGGPPDVATTIAGSQGNFGYNEATRKFNLPPSSGQAELNFYASRSTIDTGLQTVFNAQLYNANGNTLDRRDVQQDVTLNEDVGSRLTLPLPSTAKFQSALSGGLDYKVYKVTTAKTNTFTLTSVVIDYTTSPPITNINTSVIASPVPTTTRSLDYLPLSLRYNGSIRDNLGITSFGIGLSVNPWHSGLRANVENIAGSSETSGHWAILNPTISRDFTFHTNWTFSLAASGQLASEPVISNEQFGIGGLGSIRGYHEGELFGSSGWWLTSEQKTPPYLVGRVGSSALTVRGSVYMGYGEVFNLTPDSPQALWGTGFGAAASLGSHWEARFFFSWPLIKTPYTEAGQPRFDFGLSAQF